MICLASSDSAPRRLSLGAIGRVLATCVLCLATAARADLVVPANGVVDLNGGVVDLACTDLIVGGTLLLGNGIVLNARHVAIQGGGIVDGGSGTIELGGDWSNAGGFLAGNGSVRFRDLCGLASALVSGSTSFFNASFVSTTGKNYSFGTGSTQTIVNTLEIAGTTPDPIQFRSAAPGQVAFVNLQAAGTQLIQHVGVTDVWATGQWLAPFQSNEGGGGNANRWFGIPGGAAAAAIQVPSLGVLAQVMLALALAGIAILRLRPGKPRPKTRDASRATRARREVVR